VERVSEASDGTEANSFSFGAAISADGRYVAYTSLASNLVPGDANGPANIPDIFVFDRKADTTERVSLAGDGTEANGGSVSFASAISADGRYVTYESNASNLASDDTNGDGDIFVFDRKTGTTERVSVSSDGAEANSGSFASVISANVKVFGCRPFTNRAAHSSGRRRKTAKGGNRGM
jgi:hypothetical protein